MTDTLIITSRGKFHVGQEIFATYFGKGTVVSFLPDRDGVVVRWKRSGLEIAMSPHLLRAVRSKVS